MMRAMSLASVTPLIQGTLKGTDLFFSRVSIDTRTLEPGDLYIALAGERFDGHDFIPDAVRAGACAVIAEHPWDLEVPLIQVEDSRRALGLLAAVNREAFEGRVVDRKSVV